MKNLYILSFLALLTLVSAGMPAAWIAQWVAHHNKFRAIYHLSNVTWNTRLETEATEWANVTSFSSNDV